LKGVFLIVQVNHIGKTDLGQSCYYAVPFKFSFHRSCKEGSRENLGSNRSKTSNARKTLKLLSRKHTVQICTLEVRTKTKVSLPIPIPLPLPSALPDRGSMPPRPLAAARSFVRVRTVNSEGTTKSTGAQATRRPNALHHWVHAHESAMHRKSLIRGGK
jgi:hypothetical protein